MVRIVIVRIVIGSVIKKRFSVCVWRQIFVKIGRQNEKNVVVASFFFNFFYFQIFVSRYDMDKQNTIL